MIHDLLEYRSRCGSPAQLGILRFVDQNDDRNFRIVHRRVANKRHDLLRIVVLSIHNFYRGPGLAGNPVAVNVGVASGPDLLVRDDLFQIGSDFFSLFRREDLLNNLGFGVLRFTGLRIRNRLHDMGLHQLSAVGDRRYRYDLLQRRDEQLAVTVCHRRKVGLLYRIHDPFGFARKLDARLFAESKLVNVSFQPFRSQHLVTEFDESNVTGALDALQISDLAPTGSLQVMDGLSRYPDAPGHVRCVRIEQAVLYRSRQGHDFKCGARLVDRLDRMVIKILLIDVRPILVWVICRHIGHAENFHRVRIGCDHRHTDRLQLSVSFYHRLLDIILNGIIDR
ncbi:hypothetical protein D3C81_1014830 [compost metagenome]